MGSGSHLTQGSSQDRASQLTMFFSRISMGFSLLMESYGADSFPISQGCQITSWLAIVLTLINASTAFRAFTNTSIASTNLTVPCVGALSADIACSPAVAGLRLGEYYPEETLNRTCTADCGQALAQYASKVAAACDKQTWKGYEDTEMPLAIIPDMLRYHYNLTCLTDSGRYCNVVAAKAAAALDPEESQGLIRRLMGVNSSTNSTDASDLCDLCFIKNLQFQAGSPYFNGPELQERSIYQSKTSSCGVTGYPLTTSTIPFYFPQASAAPSSSANTTESNVTPCTGTTYNIKPADDCYSISTNQKISTGWLLTDNNLQAYCAGFPKSGSLCLVNKCDVYTLRQNDTCSKVAKDHSITETQLKAWNPIIDGGCYNLKRMNGTQICVSVPGKPLPAQNTTGTQNTTVPYSSGTSTITSAPLAAVPTNVAQQVNPRCSQYYITVEGDYCNLLLMKFAISLVDFLFLNKDVNANCTNLLAQYSYCVKPVGDINTYSGRPGYANTSSIEATPTLKYADLPEATYTKKNSTTTSFPLASGTRDDCGYYFNGDRFQGSLQGDWYPSQCAFVADVYDVDLDDFANWNYGLGDVRAQNCAFQKGVQYCGKYYWVEAAATTETSAPATVAAGSGAVSSRALMTSTAASDGTSSIAASSDATPTTAAPADASSSGDAAPSSPASSGDIKSSLPVREGASKSCTRYVDVAEGEKCEDVLKKNSLKIEQFYKLNPGVKEDCSNLWPNYQYCVEASE